ncbi:GNAT family N-acetyltransferase [Isoptericola hypogeus]
MNNRPTEAARETGATWQIVPDPRDFLSAARDALASDPVLGTVVATVATRLAAELERGAPEPEHPHWFALATDPSGGLAGIAMRTAPFAPHPLYLLPMAASTAAALADVLPDDGEPVTGANGAQPATEAFVARVAERAGGRARVERPTRLFEVRGLVAPPAPHGEARIAGPADLDLVQAWYRRFHEDADRQAGRARPADAPVLGSRDDVAERVSGGRTWLWTRDGTPVSMVGFAGPALGVARVGPVYTPAEHRGRGYGGALTAHVSRLLLDRELRVCLFTDLENPVSNRLYERLGYRPVVDMAELRVEPAP